MARIRKNMITQTHRSLLTLMPELSLLQPSLQEYTARFGIVHGRIATEYLLSQEYVSTISYLLKRAFILGTESIPIILHDLLIIKDKISRYSHHMMGLQEILSRYQSHLVQQDDLILLQEHMLQLCLEQANDSLLTQSAVEYWKKECPSQKIFLQKHIPVKWIPSPVLAQVSFLGLDLLEGNNGFFLISQYTVYHFSFQDHQLREVLSLPQHYAARNQVNAMKYFQNHYFIFCTQEILLLEEHDTDLEPKNIHTLDLEFIKEWNAQLYIHSTESIFVLQDDFSLHKISTPPYTVSYTDRRRFSAFRGREIHTNNLKITIQTENLGTIQITDKDHTLSLECNADTIQKYLHHNQYLALLSQRDVVVLDLRALNPLLTSPYSGLSVIYGSVQPFSELITITGSVAMDGRYLLYWSYQGISGQRTNIAFTVYDMTNEEDLYCENAQDIDEVDDVVLFEKDFYSDEEIPYIAWVQGGHRALIIDFEDVPDFAPMSHYTSDDWPYKPEDLEEAPIWRSNSMIEVESNITVKLFFQKENRIGSHLMPTETHQVCISESDDIILQSSAKIVHVQCFSVEMYQKHLLQQRT